MNQHDSTSWEKVSHWYGNIVSDQGHYYHKELIFPKLIPRLKTKKQNVSMLDLGAGAGILLSILPNNYSYTGLDTSASLLKQAEKNFPKAKFVCQDVCEPFSLEQKKFTHCSMILSLQNMKDPCSALKNAKNHLKQGGELYLVLNHPCFRVPRQSSWGYDPEQKLQYRKIIRYLSPMEVPIEAHPSKKDSPVTYSYHHSLNDLSKMLADNGFAIHLIEEWISPKKSQGRRSKQENFARSEIPLFMFIHAKSL